MTLFQKIVAREIPAKIISEDEDLIVFHDVNPQAPVHVLLVPKKPIPRLAEATAEDGIILGKLMLKAQETAKVLGVSRDRISRRHQQWTQRRRDSSAFACSPSRRTPARLATRIVVQEVASSQCQFSVKSAESSRHGLDSRALHWQLTLKTGN